MDAPRPMIGAELDALDSYSTALREAFRRFDRKAANGEWDEVAYNDLWESVKDIGRLAHGRSEHDPRPTSELAADVRAGLRGACAYECGCNDPGNPQKCLQAEQFADLDALVARVTDLEAQVEDWAQRFAALSVEHTQALLDADAAEAQVAALTTDLERAMTAAEQAIERGNTAADGWQAAKEQVAALTRSNEVYKAQMLTSERELADRTLAAEAALATTRQALTIVRDAMTTAVHASVDPHTQLLEPWDGETVHRWAPGHPMGCPVCAALDTIKEE